MVVAFRDLTSWTTWGVSGSRRPSNSRLFREEDGLEGVPDRRVSTVDPEPNRGHLEAPCCVTGILEAFDAMSNLGFRAGFGLFWSAFSYKVLGEAAGLDEGKS
jgi:hypothetical protein